MPETTRPLPDIPPDMTPQEVPQRLPEIMRKLGNWVAQEIQYLRRIIQSDPRLSDDRIASGLRARQMVISLDKSNRPSPGDVLFILPSGLDADWGTFGSVSPSGGSPSITGQPLTRTNDTNVTVTLGGTPTTALLQAVSLTMGWSGQLSIARGGTGQSTATAAFGALSPLTTKGDLLGHTGAANARTAVGTDGFVLTADSAATNGVSWQAAPATSGWTDDGTVVRLTTSTDQVGIGTVTPSSRLNVTNTNAASTDVLRLVGAASQSGKMISALNNSSRNLMSLTGATIDLGNSTDTSTSAVITFGQDNAGFGGPSYTNLNWGQNNNNLSDPDTTADQVGVVGARFYPYKDSTGQFDMGYGQSFTEAWVLISDASIGYAFYTGRHGSGTPFKRWEISGVGDQQNYGRIAIRKSPGSGGSTPELRLEETGSGTDYTAIRASSAITTSHTYVLPAAVANGIFNNSVSGSTGTLSMLTAVRGDILYGNSTPAWARLAAPGSASVLTNNGTDVAYSTIPTRSIWIPASAFLDSTTGIGFVTIGTGPLATTGLGFGSVSPYVVDTTIRTPGDASGSVSWSIVWATTAPAAQNWVPAFSYLSFTDGTSVTGSGSVLNPTISANVSSSVFKITSLGSAVGHGAGVNLRLTISRTPGAGSDNFTGDVVVFGVLGTYTPTY